VAGNGTPAIVAAERAGVAHRVHEYVHDPKAPWPRFVADGPERAREPDRGESRSLLERLAALFAGRAGDWRKLWSRS
jgi:hypothetical protein